MHYLHLFTNFSYRAEVRFKYFNIGNIGCKMAIALLLVQLQKKPACLTNMTVTLPFLAPMRFSRTGMPIQPMRLPGADYHCHSWAAAILHWHAVPYPAQPGPACQQHRVHRLCPGRGSAGRAGIQVSVCVCDSAAVAVALTFLSWKRDARFI